jgi:hypothetical protein
MPLICGKTNTCDISRSVFAIVVFWAQQKVHVTWLCIMTKFEKHAILCLMCKMSWVSLAISLKNGCYFIITFLLHHSSWPRSLCTSLPPSPYRHALQLDYVIYHIHTQVTFILKMEAACAPEKLIATNKTTWCQSPEDHKHEYMITSNFHW